MFKLNLKHLSFVLTLSAGCDASQNSSSVKDLPSRPIRLVGQEVSSRDVIGILAAQLKSKELKDIDSRHTCRIVANSLSDQNREVKPDQMYKIASYLKIHANHAKVSLNNAGDARPADFFIECESFESEMAFDERGEHMIHVLSSFFKYKSYPNYWVEYRTTNPTPTPTPGHSVTPLSCECRDAGNGMWSYYFNGAFSAGGTREFCEAAVARCDRINAGTDPFWCNGASTTCFYTGWKNVTDNERRFQGTGCTQEKAKDKALDSCRNAGMAWCGFESCR